MKRTFIVISVITFLFLFSFFLFSWKVNHGFLKQLDFDTTVKIQDQLSKRQRLDEFWEDTGFFVDPFTSIAWVMALTGIAVYDWKRRKFRPVGFLIPLAFGLIGLVEIYGKTFVNHPPPPFFMIKHPTTIFPKYHIVVGVFSYPSGHVARSTFLAGCTFLVWSMYFSGKIKKIILAAVLSAFVSVIWIGRIYLGHHWLSDTIGGFLLAGTMVMSITLASKYGRYALHYLTNKVRTD